MGSWLVGLLVGWLVGGLVGVGGWVGKWLVGKTSGQPGSDSRGGVENARMRIRMVWRTCEMLAFRWPVLLL